MDPVYGYEAINVEAQERSPFSLLHWMKRMIALRKQHPVFGRGSIEFIRTDNRKVLTYVRRYEQDIVLCVANLSRTVQPVEMPLAQFAGLTPVEMLGQTEFPRITEQPLFPDAGAVRLLLVPAPGGGDPDHRAHGARSRGARRGAGALRRRRLGLGARRQHAVDHRAPGAGAVPASGSAGSAARRARSPPPASSTG